MTTFLATTRLREFWPDGDPLTLLGLWCLSESELWDTTSRARYRIAPYPWDNRARFLDAAGYVDRVGERLLPQLADALNAAHRTSHDLRYWRIIVGPWLTAYIGALYDRYACLQGVLDQDAAPITIGLDDASMVVPEDFEHFTDAYLADGYNLQLYTRVLLELGVRLERRSLPPEPVMHRGAVGLPRVERVTGVRGALKRFQEAWVRHADLAIVGVDVPPADRLRVSASMRFRTAFCRQFAATPGARPAPDVAQRREVAQALHGTDEFGRLAARCVPDDLPLAYLEALPRPGATRRSRPSVVVTGVGWYADEQFKVFAAEARRHGARLLGVQHGGYYGMLAGGSPEVHELRVCDQFYSWGWQAPLVDSNNVTPLPAMQLARYRFRSRRPRPSGELLLVSTMHPRYLYRFNGHPVGPQWAEYVDRQHRFVARLSSEARARLVVRLYPHDYGWGVEQAWRRRFPDIRLERFSPPMSEKLRTAALLVIDHPCTTLLEATAANVPYVLCWDRQQFPMREAARDVFDGFHGASVLFDAPEDAADQVNRIMDSAEAWWHSPAVTAATEACRVKFAATSPDWRRIWRHELETQARRARAH